MKSILLICALLIASVLLSHGQDKPKASPTATPTPNASALHMETNPSGSFEVEKRNREAAALKLTEAETAAGIKLQGEFDAANEALEAHLKESQPLTADKDLLLSAWKLKTLYTNFTASRARITAWFTAAQKAHACEGCLLEKGVFIKPEVKK
jgi:hypothetical protein